MYTTDTMLNREEALQLLKKYLKTENLYKHSLAVEAILQATAQQLHKDEHLWGITGLLHDLDYDFTKTEPQNHAKMTVQILTGLLPDKAINAIKSHNYHHTNQVPETSLDKALIAADAVSGLIIATALVMPTKKIADVQLSTLINKFKDNSFARGCDRKRIELSEDFGVPLDYFLELSLKALTEIAEPLGL